MRRRLLDIFAGFSAFLAITIFLVATDTVGEVLRWQRGASWDVVGKNWELRVTPHGTSVGVGGGFEGVEHSGVFGGFLFAGPEGGVEGFVPGVEFGLEVRGDFGVGGEEVEAFGGVFLEVEEVGDAVAGFQEFVVRVA